MTGSLERPGSLAQLLAVITPEIHAQLKLAVELGRWQNGERLTEVQKALCLQAVIAYDAANLNAEKRVGFVRRGKTQCDSNGER